MKRIVTGATAAAALTGGVVTPLAAHPAHSPLVEFGIGLLHPLTGLDHILTLVLLGVVAASLSRRAGTAWLGTAAAFAALGATAGGPLAGAVPYLEAGVVGALLLFVAGRAPGSGTLTATAALLAAVAGATHGAAHAAGSITLPALVGLLAATAGLVAVGAVVGAATPYPTRGPARDRPVHAGS